MAGLGLIEIFIRDLKSQGGEVQALSAACIRNLALHDALAKPLIDAGVVDVSFCSVHKAGFRASLFGR